MSSLVLGLGALTAATALLIEPEATGSSKRDAASAPVRPVAVAEVGDRPQVRRLSFAGVVRATRRAEVGFVLGGRVTERLVELGDRVQEGDPIARLDRRQLRRAVETADAVVARAEADLAHGRREQQRVLTLSEAEAASMSDADAADHTTSVAAATARQAKAQARAARRDLAEGIVRAPFAGRVSRIDVEPGELVATGQSIVEIVGDDAHELEVQLPESMLADVAEGQSVTVELPLLDRRVQGVVRIIGAAAPQTAGLFPVVIDLPHDATLRAGMTARLVVDSRVPDGWVVPVEAVIDRGGGVPRVITVDDGHTQRREIAVLAIAGRDAVISGPLHAGQLVVTRGHAGLADGDTVTVQR